VSYSLEARISPEERKCAEKAFLKLIGRLVYSEIEMS
jgi:hypothetical protein